MPHLIQTVMMLLCVALTTVSCSENPAASEGQGIDAHDTTPSDDTLHHDGQPSETASNDATTSPDLPDSHDILEDLESGSGHDLGSHSDLGTQDDTGPEACDPPLVLSGLTALSLPMQLHQLQASGGTGAYRFSLHHDNATGLLDPLLGSYVAGPVSGAVDTIVVHDLGCVGEATASTTVVPYPATLPAHAIVPPGQTIQFVAEGGGGAWEWALQANTGATLVPNELGALYTAGPLEGEDEVLVQDLVTTASAKSVIEVDASEGVLRANPTQWVIPTGNRSRPEILGGSGSVKFSSTDSTVVTTGEDDELLQGISPGTAAVLVTDQYTGQSTVLTVSVARSHQAPGLAGGDLRDRYVIRSAHDIDDDGYVDAVIGAEESDVAGYNAGAVLIYRGGEAGLETDASQILVGESRRMSHFGRALALADFDGDGALDLVVGAYQDATTTVNGGSAFLYRGLVDGLFEDSPSRVFRGTSNYDWFGHAVAACDFNRDGWPDLAIGAPRDNANGSDDGSVSLWLGEPGGLAESVHQTLTGLVPDTTGNLVAQTSIEFGASLAAGDLDGDGICDLAVGGEGYKSSSDEGLVAVHRGVAASGTTQGGLSPEPVRLLTGRADGVKTARLGEAMVVGDLDGDLIGELVLGAHRYEPPDSGATDVGGVFIFNGGPDFAAETVTELESYESASQSIVGSENFAFFGHGLAIGDWNGTGTRDLICGHSHVSVEGKRQGIVSAHAGVPAADIETTPSQSWAGQSTQGHGRFGQAVGLLDDYDGDGINEVLTVASRDTSQAMLHGRAFVLSSDDNTSPVALNQPLQISGDHFGHSAIIPGDLTGDGHADLVVGAPLAQASFVDQGLAYLYRGGPEGFESEPAMVFGQHPGHTQSAQLGFVVNSVGDFDGDGQPDVAIVARYEDRPANPDDNYYQNPSTCDDTSPPTANVGAILVYRGVTEGLPSNTPSFIWYGPEKDDFIQDVAGGFDADGDGYDDLWIGGRHWDEPAGNNAGGGAIVRGRPVTAEGKTEILCETWWRLNGARKNDHMGYSVAVMGDIDGDGCAELAIGAYAEDGGGLSDSGVVRVLRGFGQPSCPQEGGEGWLFHGHLSGQYMGWSLAGGRSVDSDVVPDLLIGGPSYARSNRHGAVYVISGAALAQNPTQDLRDPNAVATALQPALIGATPGTRFGFDLALAQDAGTHTHAVIVVGDVSWPTAETQHASGAVHLYRSSTNGTWELLWRFGGEAERPGGLLGSTVATGVHSDGKSTLVFGGYLGNGLEGIDRGSLYSVKLGAW